jgi:NTE family protein
MTNIRPRGMTLCVMPVDPQVRIQGLYFLKRNPIFSALGEEVLGQLADLLKTLNQEKGTLLLREGDPVDGLYLIRSGRVRITTYEDKEEKSIAFLGRGDAVGELSMLTGEVQEFNAVLDTPCEFLMLSKRDFDSILEAHPLVGINLSRALSRRLAVSFHPPQERFKEPQLIAVAPGVPHEAAILSTVNMAISIVEQTRRKVILVDLSPRSGDIAQALGLHPPLSTEKMFREEDFQDFPAVHRALVTHPCGLEILSIHPQALKGLHSSIPTLLSMLKDHYDFTLVQIPVERDALSEVVLREVDKILLVIWDQASDMGAVAQQTLKDVMGSSSTPLLTVALQYPSELGKGNADFRVPWSETFHQPFRENGTPYLPQGVGTPAMAAFDRIARTLGKLRVGLAMGSGAAYGYTLVGLLKVFEREGIPIDMVAGTSMGALLGGFFCAGKTPTEIEDISRTITKRWLFENIMGDITIPHSGFLAGQTLSAFLRSVIGHVEFHQLPIPFSAVATDIRSGHEVVIKEGRVSDAIRASTSLPILFRPFLHKGRFLVDGGLVNPVPTSTVANMGADILISVNLTAKPSVRRGLGRYRASFPLGPRSPGMMEVFFKMLYTMQYEIAQARTEIAHVVIAPDLRDYLWTDFYRSDDILKIGAAAAEEAVPKIKSLLPFFSDYCKVPLGISLRAY